MATDNKPKVIGIYFIYDDGSSEYAVGDHAQEVMNWYNSGQSMLYLHGGEYKGRKMMKIESKTAAEEHPQVIFRDGVERGRKFYFDKPSEEEGT